MLRQNTVEIKYTIQTKYNISKESREEQEDREDLHISVPEDQVKGTINCIRITRQK